MKVHYAKPYLTIDKQVDLLASRGLRIKDRSVARDLLTGVNYYRLTGYAIPHRICSAAAFLKSRIDMPVARQYKGLTVSYSDGFHDRFVIIDSRMSAGWARLDGGGCFTAFAWPFEFGLVKFD